MRRSGQRRARPTPALVAACLLAFAAGADPAQGGDAGDDPEARERVVLLHGLLRQPRSMKPLAQRLTDEGFEVHNLGYASTDDTATQIVDGLAASIDDCCASAQATLHFVTHSLGGVVARAYLSEHRPDHLGRVVMLAPPNRGSPLVDRFGDDFWFRSLLGPVATELGSGPASLPNRLPPPTYPVGIIAARHAVASALGGAWLGDNDGIVSVDATRLPGMTDFLVVRTGHVRIRRDDVVADETVHFLRHGRFQDGLPGSSVPSPLPPEPGPDGDGSFPAEPPTEMP